MGSKTPVSILQEMCIRKGSPPQYELIHDGGGSHEALFKYRVLVGETTAVGSGRSKKEAKHDAAKCILKRLNELGTSSPEPIPDEMIYVSDVTSPYMGNLQGNAVGELQELCLTNDIQVPEYKVIGDEGPPHAKKFTFLCQVSKLEETAVARTKKQAKQKAAFRMLNRLKTSLADVLTLTVSEKGDVSSEKQGDEKLKKEARQDPMGVLKRILEELTLDADFNGIEASDQCVILLSISTSPESVVFGMASTAEEAYKSVATNALDHLKIMTA